MIDSLTEFFEAFYPLMSSYHVTSAMRELGVPARVKVAREPGEIADFVVLNNRRRVPSHASTNLVTPASLLKPEEQFISPDELGTIPTYIDRFVVEPENLKDFDKLKRHLITWLNEWRNNGIRPVVVFSGNKSWHLHFILPRLVPIKSKDWFDMLYWAFIEYLAQALPSNEKAVFRKSLDLNVGNIRAMHRAPWSLNEKSGNYSCVASPRTLECLDLEEATVVARYAKLDEYEIKELIANVNLEEALNKLNTGPVLTEETRSEKTRSEKPGSAKTTGFYEELLRIKGLEDGRKRILYYFLIPYLVNTRCQGINASECVDVVIPIVKEWISKQSGVVGFMMHGLGQK